MKTSDFDFELPESCIALSPTAARDDCKLLVFDTHSGEIFHKRFFEIGEFLNAGDVLVWNRSKVVAARLIFSFDGKRREIFLIEKIEENLYQALVKPGRFFKIGRKFELVSGLFAEVKEIFEDGTRLILFSGVDFAKKIEKLGQIPLPPYIKSELKDPDDYQTIYAKEEGSVAAPTAGLHFTKELVEALRRKGIDFQEVILHVGRGTFLPVDSEKIEDHVMHGEKFEMPFVTAENLNKAINCDRRIIAVGTTSVRVLESNFEDKFSSSNGETDIFIYPGKYKWKCVDGLITNFHLPKSTLIMLVASFLEHKGVVDPVKKILDLYKLAKDNDYRFYSFGDAMLLI